MIPCPGMFSYYYVTKSFGVLWSKHFELISRSFYFSSSNSYHLLKHALILLYLFINHFSFVPQLNNFFLDLLLKQFFNLLHQLFLITEHFLFLDTVFSSSLWHLAILICTSSFALAHYWVASGEAFLVVIFLIDDFLRLIKFLQLFLLLLSIINHLSLLMRSCFYG